MMKPMRMAIVVAFASATLACGRDDNQEKTGAAISNKNSASSVVGGDTAASPTKGPLQTGEAGATSAEMPSGTKTGARTTPNPQ
jgi:hypothetical protein